MKSGHNLTNEELETCIASADCITDPELVRSILNKEYVLHDDGTVDEFEFAEQFALAVQGFITEDEDTDEYDEAWDANHEMGYAIAGSINDFIEES